MRRADGAGEQGKQGGAARRGSARICGVPPLECIRAVDDPRPRVYSQFDWYAMAFGRAVNAMATTCLTPVAYMLANRDEPKPEKVGGVASWINHTVFDGGRWRNYDDWMAIPHHGRLAKSGGIIAAVSVGAMLSTTAAFFLLPDSWKDGKLPFFLGTVFPYLGISIYIIAVLVPGSAQFHSSVVILSRVTLALGYGLQFCIKRQIARVATSKRRGDLMLWNNTFDIVGMASGPTLVGLCLMMFTKDTVEKNSSAPRGSEEELQVVGVATARSLAERLSQMVYAESMQSDEESSTTAKLLVPAFLLIIVVTMNLIGILYGDMDQPFFEDGSGEPIVDAPNETTPLTATSKASAGKKVPPASAPTSSTPLGDAGQDGTAGKTGATTLHEAPGHLDGRPNDHTLAGDEPAGPPFGPEGAPLWVARSVQLTCISYTFTRVFLRYSYESAMVVIYSQTYHFTDGVAGLIAGASAFFALLAVFLWHRARNASAALGKSDAHTAHAVMVVSELCGFACALVMMITPTIGKYLGQHWGVGFTLLTAVFFYPSQVLGASIANSYPLDYAVPNSRWLNRNAMLVQQELVMPIGNGCGMMLGRVMTGTNAPTFLLCLGISFTGVMLLQALIVSIGWDPVRTRKAWRRCCCGRRGSDGG